MKIKNIQVSSDKKCVYVSADCTIRRFGHDTLYFKIDKKYHDFLYKDASPFAAALLLPAMKLGVDLSIEGSISEKLYQGMQKMMNPRVLKGLGLYPIRIHADTIAKDTHNPTEVGSFFSGGVDSFYTYMQHRKGKDAINYFILVDGFDIDLRNKELWNITNKTVQKIAQHDRIKVITLESNLRPLIDVITPWSYSFAGGAAAVALLLRMKMRKAYKASSFQYGQVSGPTDGILDNYFQTEKLSLTHDGGEASRIEKIKAIAKSKLALEYLRVCYMNKQGSYNCGTCDKCLRTMIGLHIAGKLAEAKTFPHAIDMERIKSLHVTNKFGAIFHKENLSELRKLGIEKELQEAIKTCLQTPAKESVFKEYYSKVAFIDHIYFRGQIRKLHSLVTR